MGRLSLAEEKRTEALRMLYAPYMALVFSPYLAVSTVVMGSLAVLVAPLNRTVAHHFGTAWAWALCRANFTRVKVEGLEHADPRQSYIIMSNHQSHFDVLAFYGHFWRQFRWVMKEELRKVPGLGPYCAKMGHIFIDRSDPQKAIQSLKDAQKTLPPGVSVMIFPEGSRSPDGRLAPFKKGGFVMAQQMGLPILPVTITGTHEVLPGKSYKLLPGRVRIAIHEPIDVRGYGEADRGRLMDDVRASIASGLPEQLRG